MLKYIHRSVVMYANYRCTRKKLFKADLFKSMLVNSEQFVRPLTTCGECSEFSGLEDVGYESGAEEAASYDVVIVGGGIVGSATALRLKKQMPELTIAIVEKEGYIAAHQSTNNSGVIHAGIYYRPGSLRAKMCVKGMLEMYKYCEEHNIPHKRNGKLIVATNSQEVQWLMDLHQRGLQNEVPGLEIIAGEQIKEFEPHCEGLKAINSPYTGIVEFGEVCRHFASSFRELGGRIYLNYKVIDFAGLSEGDGTTQADTSRYPVTVYSDRKAINAGFVLTCCGLQADEISKLTNEPADPKIIPFRGTYYVLNPEKQHWVNGNIYPVPDPKLPFPGVHFTPKMNGSIWCGPTAMIAFKKEAYEPFDFDLKEFMELVQYPGLQKFVFKFFARNISEFMKSTSNAAQLVELQKYIKNLNVTDLCPGPSGVQAQAMDINGNLVEDFAFHSSHRRILHCRNCPSPAATSSIAISKYVGDKVMGILKELEDNP